MRIHNNYIFFALGLNILSIASYFYVPIDEFKIVNYVTAIMIVFLLYFDSRLLEKNDKQIVSKIASILVYWVYLYQRDKLLDNKFRFFFISIATSIIGTALVWNMPSTPQIEKDACEIVTRIQKEKLFRPDISCKNLTITNSNGKVYSGLAELSDESFVNVSVTALNDNRIYVEIIR